MFPLYPTMSRPACRTHPIGHSPCGRHRRDCRPTGAAIVRSSHTASHTRLATTRSAGNLRRKPRAAWGLLWREIVRRLACPLKFRFWLLSVAIAGSPELSGGSGQHLKTVSLPMSQSSKAPATEPFPPGTGSPRILHATLCDSSGNVRFQTLVIVEFRNSIK